MAKKRKKKKVSKTEPEPMADTKPSKVKLASRGFAELIFRPRVLVLVAVTISGIMMTARIKQWLPKLAARPEYQITIQDIEVIDAPYWIPHDIVHQAITGYGLPTRMSVLDDDLAEKIAKAFLHHPWVTDVTVRIESRQRVIVTPTFRVPVAMVEMRSGGMYPIDTEGVLLPPADFRQADTWRYPVIRRVTSTPQGPAGSEWGDISVKAAASVAKALLKVNEDGVSHWQDLGLTAILAPRRTAAVMTEDDLMFELQTRDGSRIVWGRAPKTEYPGEVDTSTKMSRMHAYLERFKSFNEPNGPYEIDVYHLADEIIRRPMSTATRGRRRL